MGSFRPALVAIFAAILFCGLPSSWLYGQDFHEVYDDPAVSEKILAGNQYFNAASYRQAFDASTTAYRRSLDIWGADDWRTRLIDVSCKESRRFMLFDTQQYQEYKAARQKRMHAERLMEVEHDYKAALAVYEEVKQVYDQLLTADSQSWTYFMLQYSQCLVHVDRKEDALSVIDQAISARERMFGQQHPVTAKAMTIRALLDLSIGNRDKAEQLLKESQAIYKLAGLDRTSHYASVLMGLSHISLIDRQPRAALEQTQTAMRILAAFPEETDQGQMAVFVEQYARTLRLTGDHIQAEQQIERAIKLAQKLENQDEKLNQLLRKEQKIIREARHRQRYPDLQ